MGRARRKQLVQIQKLGRLARRAAAKAANEQGGGPLYDALEHLSHSAQWVEDIVAAELSKERNK